MSDQEKQNAIDTLRRAIVKNPHNSVNSKVNSLIKEHHLAYGEVAVESLAQLTHRSLYGAGMLQPLLEDPQVTDVLVNDENNVWIDRGHGLEKTNITFSSPEELRSLAVRLAAASGNRLDDSSPTVDGRLPDGTRLHAMLAPLCESAALISLRTLKQTALTLSDLVQSGTIHPNLVPVLQGLVDYKKNYLIAGATGSGKTTLLSTLLSLVPNTERIMTIEESREIKPNHPHVVALETKGPNIEGKGEVTQRDLIRNALRARPDRLVIGECRGAEILDMMTALNTGHGGGCGTIHANSAQDVVARLYALGALGGFPDTAVERQSAAAFDAVIFVQRQPDTRFPSARFISEIATLEPGPHGLTTRPLIRWQSRAVFEMSNNLPTWATGSLT